MNCKMFTGEMLVVSRSRSVKLSSLRSGGSGRGLGVPFAADGGTNYKTYSPEPIHTRTMGPICWLVRGTLPQIPMLELGWCWFWKLKLLI